ncbi:MAG TPA: bifunctional diguanylate cyclase/phosphodiesterase, partial [Acidimicrobiales bacterium]
QDLDGLMSASKPLAVAFLGLDRFKMINDSLGHTAGDAVLEAVAARLTSVLPASTTVGSFGGDVFVILIRGAASADARTLLWRVVQRLSEPLFIAGHELRLSSSAGIAGRDAAATAESLLRDAGLAMHRAKAAGGGQVELFEVAMREEAVTRLELEASLRGAIARSELSLALQPVVRLDDATPVGAEALVRWHRETDTVEPARFVAIAEESGLIITLGEWILDHAARAVRHAPGGHVVVNLSARQLASPGLPDRIARVLAAHRLPPSSLGFEITETLVVERFDYVVSVLHAIRNLGCQVGLDDFGTGYSSLGYLRRLPIDFLKIDGSLTADVDSDCQARAIAGAIITMADALGLEVVAEGVETEAQATELRGLGCQLAQGYFFGRPTEI